MGALSGSTSHCAANPPIQVRQQLELHRPQFAGELAAAGDHEAGFAAYEQRMRPFGWLSTTFL